MVQKWEKKSDGFTGHSVSNTDEFLITQQKRFNRLILRRGGTQKPNGVKGYKEYENEGKSGNESVFLSGASGVFELVSFIK